MYRRIFWLDDSPNFFDRMEVVAKRELLSFDLTALANRTRFAFDLEMAIQIVKQDQFDLYILDGDFPDRMPDERRAALEAYIAKVRTGLVDHFNDYPRKEDHEDNVYNNGFIFYGGVQFPEDAKVVVHSMSLAAPVLAYIFGLPIYTKNDRPEEAAEQLKKDFAAWRFDRVSGAWERFIAMNGGNIDKIPLSPVADLSFYEHGGRTEFIKHYILPL
ncbi:hypothetical protein COV16_02820 [Candidatus Woesearchaeota archaeon CG10_big_fil_rev_8_21_14_0_10_34_8]|nr:MAG: hypothetical protein COV16_02820 [Candidatus Woesearchaeota archaeon CG10_big_fil_rev_8_21_14_0_10_34_8]